MSCFKPKILWGRTGERTQANDGHFYQKWHVSRPYFEGTELEEINKGQVPANLNYMIIPCGRCIGCRLDYSRTWANRGYLESKMWANNYFVTLTYNDENLPEGGTLIKDHMSSFMKRLREDGRRNGWQHSNIRFMGAGEYGEKLQRPHYHIILFNCNLPQDSFYKPWINNKNTYYQNKIIERNWKYGFSSISEVTWNNIAYVARYVTKKIYGEKSEEHYEGRQPEFLNCSRNPGIGIPYLKEHPEIYDKDKIIVMNKKGTHEVNPPRAFDVWMKKIDEDKINEVKKKRKALQRMRNIIKAENTSLTMMEQLGVEERAQAEREKMLIRQYESSKN